MICKPKLAPPRSGFTLIELLIVIAIIATLIALIVPAVMKVMDRMNETKARTEIAQLETALQNFSQDHHGVPLPSSLTLRESGVYPAGDPTGAFLRRAFGKNIGAVAWSNPGGQPNAQAVWTLNGAQCLVFYLGGPQGTFGFSNSSTNPLSAQGSPYFNFQASRLIKDNVRGTAAFPAYADPWPQQQAIAYFSANGVQNGYSVTDCSATVVPGTGTVPWPSPAVPWVDTAAGSVFVNPNTYQILCAGRNGVFGGQGSTTAMWNSQSGTLDPNGKDDQANFSARLLVAGAQ